MADNTDVLNTLLTSGAPTQAQGSVNNGIQALMQLLQKTPNPDSANSALGPATINVLNNVARATNNPAMAYGNYDVTQNTGINQDQLAKNLQNFTPNGQGSNLPPSQQLIQETAKKAYTKQLQAHADATPHEILGNLLDQWGANGGTQVPMASPTGANPGASTAQTAQLPSNVIPQSQSQTQAQSNGSQTQQKQSIKDYIATIDEQAQLNLAQRNLAQSKDPNFLQRFSQQFSKMTGGVTQGEQLENIAAMQKIAGGEPLQSKDVGELNARTYGAALEASHQAASLEAQKLPALIDLYGKVSESRPAIQKQTGWTTDEQKNALTALSTAGENLNTHIKNLNTLINNRPTFSSKGMDKQAQDTSSKVKQGQVGKYTYR